MNRLSCCTPSRNGPLPDQETFQAIASGATEARVHFSGGRSFVGTNRPELPQDGEGPQRAVKLGPFWLDTYPVTNARFAAFVSATGYSTEAERFGWSPVFRGLLDQHALPHTSAGMPWWIRVDGACWHSPEGPGSSVAGRENHPVVHMSWADATNFAHWCGGRLPSEAEWEHAARGGLDDPKFPWGNAEPGERDIFANIWQGEFPNSNTLADGYLGTSPVASFRANGAGLFDMAGNVWEWTSDAFRVRSLGRQARERNALASRTKEKVLKGGSFLCHVSYCYRYRIAARSALTADSSASNTGVRVAYNG